MEFKTQGYESILKPISKSPYTGKESFAPTFNPNIKLFKDEYGSERFIYYLNGRSVSALQIIVRDGVKTVANVITKEKYRRKGYAKLLWEEAKKHHDHINHSHHLSEDGKIFAKHCTN